MASHPPAYPGTKYTVKRGDSFRGASSLHTMHYSFKPESAARAKFGCLKLGLRGATMLSIPTLDRDVVFDGNVDEHKETEFALIRAHDGSWRLERLSDNVKNTTVRRENAGGRAPPDVRESHKKGAPAEQTSERAVPAKSPAKSPVRSPRKSPAKSPAKSPYNDDADVDDDDLFGGESD